MWLKSISKGNNTNQDAVNLYTGGAGFNAEVIRRLNVSYYPRVLLVDQQGRMAGNDNGRFKSKENIISTIKSLLSKRAI